MRELENVVRDSYHIQIIAVNYFVFPAHQTPKRQFDPAKNSQTLQNAPFVPLASSLLVPPAMDDLCPVSRTLRDLHRSVSPAQVLRKIVDLLTYGDPRELYLRPGCRSRFALSPRTPLRCLLAGSRLRSRSIGR